jgi:hypothetical protein
MLNFLLVAAPNLAAPRAAQYSDTTGRELNNPRLEIGEIRARMSSYSAFVSAFQSE